MPPSLSELTVIMVNTELIYLGSEAPIHKSNVYLYKCIPKNKLIALTAL